MKEPGRRKIYPIRKGDSQIRGQSGKLKMVIGQPSGAPTPPEKSEPSAEEAPAAEVADLRLRESPPVVETVVPVAMVESLEPSLEETAASAPGAGEHPVYEIVSPSFHQGWSVASEVTGHFPAEAVGEGFAPREQTAETVAESYQGGLQYSYEQAAAEEQRETDHQYSHGTVPEPSGEVTGSEQSSQVLSPEPGDLSSTVGYHHDEAVAAEPPARETYDYRMAPVREKPSREYTRATRAYIPIPPPPFFQTEPAPELEDPPGAYHREGSLDHHPAVPEPAPVTGQATTWEEEEAAALPTAFQPRYSPDYVPPVQHNLPYWLAALLSLVCLLAGAAGGYFLPGIAGKNAGPTKAGTPGGKTGRLLPDEPAKDPAPRLTPAQQDEVDAAFTAAKAGKFTESAQLFTALQNKHPEWGSMGLETGRALLYQHDVPAARASLEAALAKGVMPADAHFLLALLSMTDTNFAEAEASFAKATALDPARPDFYYFWGECLRREGKPMEAIGKFHAALIRNQYETTDGLYRLKLWLSEIQADQENSNGTSALIEEGLAKPRPPMEALLAGAARAIKAGQITVAAGLMRRARQVVEPTVFFVIMQDPAFAQEVWRPELADFYKPEAGAGKP